ncbi:MAG: HAD-IC family P-type ATPase [Candidatus Limiplasma sp.]|nr:HAD-IC family P-type ATPase [Candidatus Limiplasma sp.]
MEGILKPVEQAATDSIHRLASNDTYALLGSSPNGLAASDAAERLRAYGKNVISEKKEKPVILILLANFISMMAILLWIGGVIAFFAGMPELAFAIWMVNIINGVFSFWQEFRAIKATEALKKMLSSYVRVVRGGAEQQILAEDLVPGDVMIVTEGDKISADARLLTCMDLQVNQSTLTGESNPVRKTSEAVLREGLGRSEIPNLIFAGTSVSSGNGKAIVVSTGMETMFGKIANLTQSMKEAPSPLQKELDLLTKQVSVMAVSLGVAFFLVSVFIDPAPERCTKLKVNQSGIMTQRSGINAKESIHGGADHHQATGDRGFMRVGQDNRGGSAAKRYHGTNLLSVA